MSAPQKQSSPQPQLRLFSPSAPDGLSAEHTLKEFYFAFVRPNCLQAKGAATRNLAEYDTSLKYWAELTGDPPLSQIDDTVTGAFLLELQQQSGKKKPAKMRKTTIRKHCRHLQYCLDRAGPRSRDSRQGQNLIGSVPFLERPRAARNHVIKNFTLPEISAILKNCDGLLWPVLDWVAAPVWWRSLITLAYNTGLRIGTLLELRFDWLRVDELGSWVDVPDWAYKTEEARSFYLNRWALAAIEAMGTPYQGPIFSWPYDQTWLHKVRRKLFAQAGLSSMRSDGNGFHGLRKAFVTELTKINAAAAKMAAGHARDITIDYYTAQIVMVEAMNQLPQP